MTETYETVTVAGEQITVSLLVWRRFKRPMPGLVERVYEINPALAKAGPFLTLGAAVTLPIPAPKKVETVTPIRLWS